MAFQSVKIRKDVTGLTLSIGRKIHHPKPIPSVETGRISPPGSYSPREATTIFFTSFPLLTSVQTLFLFLVIRVAHEI